MMICKTALLNDLESPVARILEKSGGVPNSAKRQESRLLPILRRQGYVQPRNAQHAFEARGSIEDGAARVPANDRFDGGGRRLHASRDDYYVRAPQSRERLPR